MQQQKRATTSSTSSTSITPHSTRLIFTSSTHHHLPISSICIHLYLPSKMLRLKWTRSTRQVLRMQQLSTANSSPTTAVRTNTAIDQTSLWSYLTAKGVEGFSDHQQCVMKQFAHGRLCDLHATLLLPSPCILIYNCVTSICAKLMLFRTIQSYFYGDFCYGSNLHGAQTASRETFARSSRSR